jgi:hypothetical protein
MRALLSELYRRNRLLAAEGWLFAALAAALAVAALVDHRQVEGVNVWLKPIKFLVSVAIYLWTLAWFLAYLERPRWALRTIAGSAAGLMLVEMACIIFQAARGRMSHYNNATPLDSAIFDTMGAMIFFNTFLEAWLLALFVLPRTRTGRADLAPAYLWGIRLGLVATLFSAVVGMMMIADGQHAVGVPDGGPGLPVLNWSTTGGDLRASHAITLHGLQLLPLAGFLISGWQPTRSRRAQLAAIATAAAVYGAVALWTFWQAMHGQPLVAAGWIPAI